MNQAGLLSVVLLGGHDHCLVAAQISAFAHEREQTAGRAEPPAAVGVEGLPQLAMNGVGFRGGSFPGGTLMRLNNGEGARPVTGRTAGGACTADSAKVAASGRVAQRESTRFTREGS